MVNPPADLAPEGRFVGREHLFALRVYFVDTDLSGVVYHANYLRFMERARSDMLRAAGIDKRGAAESGDGVYAIADLGIRYMRPARMEDALLVRSRVVAVRAAATVVWQRIDRDGALLADAAGPPVLLLGAGRPQRPP